MPRLPRPPRPNKKLPPTLQTPRPKDQQQRAQLDPQSNDQQSAKEFNQNWILLQRFRIWDRQIMRRLHWRF